MQYKSAKANPSDQKDQRKGLRHRMTHAEVVLWLALKNRGVGGYKFRRQQGIGPYILDFYCPELHLCVELDGSSHEYKSDYDAQRTNYLNNQGIRVVRFKNEQVITCLEGVIADILRIGKEIKH
ncbi:MAG: endonuclease domain-containing protein [Prevotella sp.]|nr:endonuclease domain-containing protein [Prevotella sp.]